LAILQKLTDEVVQEVAAKDKMTQKVYTSFKTYRDQVKK